MCFAHIATQRTPGCLFRRVTRLKRAAGFTNASPVSGLRNLKREDGDNLIEYALVFMFFLSMVLGIVDFSRALYTYHFLSNAARDATRWAAVRGSTCDNDESCASPATKTDIQNYVANIMPPGVNPADLKTTPSWPGIDACNNPGCPVKVLLTYNFNFVVPFIRSTPLPLSSSSEMIIVH
jgi:Flp pilus assembly protein TadG